MTATLSIKKVAGSSLLRGRVVDEAGNPISGIFVSLRGGQSAMEGVDWSVHTDDGGRFAWNQAPEGTVQLSFSSPYCEQKDIGLTNGDTEHLIAMTTRKTAEAHCIVTDKTSGLAIPRFKVLVGTRDTSWHNGQDDVKFEGEGASGHFIFPWRPNELRDKGRLSVPIVRIEADGYEPETVGLPNAADALEIKVELDPAHPLEGVVLTPSGEPASRAQMALTGGNLSMWQNAPARFAGLDAGREHTTTARSDGSFSIAARKGTERMLIVHDAGWAILPLEQFVGGAICLRSWGRVQGTLFIGRQAAANQNIRIGSSYGQTDGISFSFNGKTDAEGGFAFDKVPPGKVCVTRWVLTPFSRHGAGFTANTQEQTVDVKSGETTRIVLGGKGARVKGKLVMEPLRADAALELAAQYLSPSQAITKPGELPKGYGFFCQPDGSFASEDVLPGAYVLKARIRVAKDRYNPTTAREGFNVGERNVEVIVPEGQEEFDLGNIVVPVKSDPLPAGDP